MSDAEQAVRDAARALHEAITKAGAAGYRVAWPHGHEGLPGIAVSETAARQSLPAAPACTGSEIAESSKPAVFGRSSLPTKDKK